MSKNKPINFRLFNFKKLTQNNKQLKKIMESFMVSFSATSRVLHAGLKKHKQELQAVLNPTLTTEQQNRKISIAKDSGLIKQLRDNQSNGSKLFSLVGNLSELVSDFKAKYSQSSSSESVNNGLNTLRGSINALISSSEFSKELTGGSSVAKQGLTLGKISQAGENQVLDQQSGSKVKFFAALKSVSFDKNKTNLHLDNGDVLVGKYSKKNDRLVFKGKVDGKKVRLAYDLSENDLFNGYKNADSAKRQDIIRSVFNADESGNVVAVPAFFSPGSESDFGFSVLSLSYSGYGAKVSVDNSSKEVSLMVNGELFKAGLPSEKESSVTFDGELGKITLTMPSYNQGQISNISDPIYLQLSSSDFLVPSQFGSVQSLEGLSLKIPALNNFATGLANLSYQSSDQFSSFSDSLDSALTSFQNFQTSLSSSSSGLDSISSILEQRKSLNESLNEADPLEQAQKMADIYQKIMLTMHSISVISNLQKEMTNAFRQLSSS